MASTPAERKRLHQAAVYEAAAFLLKKGYTPTLMPDGFDYDILTAEGGKIKVLRGYYGPAKGDPSTQVERYQEPKGEGFDGVAYVSPSGAVALRKA